MNTIIVKEYVSPFGELIIGSFEDKLCLCDWKYRKMREQNDGRITKGLKAEYKEGNSNIIEQTIHELELYAERKLKEFTIPLLLVGSDFQKETWDALLSIPYGQTKTYLQQAKAMNNEKAIRAVATANGANVISIIVPCHRIIGSDGSLVGYAGGLPAKKKLLELECSSNQLELFV